MNKFYLQNIEKSYVIDLLKSIDATKSAGLDIIPLGLMKEEAEQIALPLAALINRSLQSGVFSTAEKEAKISPIHKCESKSLLDNYLPISVLNIFSKILERVVYSQLSFYLEQITCYLAISMDLDLIQGVPKNPKNY